VPGLPRFARLKRLTSGVLVTLALSGCGSSPSPDALLEQAERLRLTYEAASVREAIDSYRRARTAAEDGDRTVVAARALQGIGAAYKQLGLLLDSRSHYMEALSVAERGTDRLFESEVRSDAGVGLALAVDSPESLDEARQQCQIALDLARRLSGLREEAKALDCLGEVSYHRGGQLEGALQFHLEAEGIWERVRDLRGRAQSQLLQSYVHSDLLHFDRAQTCLDAARSLWHRLGDSRGTAITLVAQGRLRSRRGQYEDALRDFDAAARLLEPMDDLIWEGAALTGKGTVYLYMADTTTALKQWEAALHNFQTAGMTSIAVDILISLGETALRSGDDSGARNRFVEAQALATRLNDRRWQAWASRYIGVVRLFAGEPAQAAVDLRRSLDLVRSIREPRLEALVLTDLGEAYQQLNEPTRAIQSYDRALALSRASGDRLETARELFLRGTLAMRRGNLKAARANLTEALSEREAFFGAHHPLVAAARAAIAEVDFRGGASATSLAGAIQAEQVSRDHLRFTVRYLPERQALTLAANRPRGLDLALSIVASGASPNRAAVFDAVIQSRGTILDELAARNRALDYSDASVAALNARVTAERQRFANLVVRSMSESVPRTVLDEARLDKEKVERELAERSATARASANRLDVGIEEVRNALPDRSVLVSFVEYERTSPNRAGGRAGLLPVTSLAAIVMRSDSTDVRVVPLGPASVIAALVSSWREEASGRELLHNASTADRTYRVAGERLRKAVWDPIAPASDGVSQILIVPDGAVSLVAFAALPIGSSSYLLDRWPAVHYLSAERDLVPGTPARPASGAGLLALGDPLFDEGAPIVADGPESSESPATRAPARSEASGAPCGRLSDIRFDRLAATRLEVDDIAGYWNTAASHGLGAARVLSGTSATERAVKQEAAGHRVLHFATHGFFFGNGCAAGPAGTRGVGGITTQTGAPDPAFTDNPLLLSGLALAGANGRAMAGPDEDDGILMAEEVASLDLSGVEWAVLSACDTGVGEIRAGEGVFGLRRAFQVAGARTVIMSLWSVEDQATRAWMRALYEARFQKRLSTADAVHAASLAMLQERRAKGQSTHPFFWAAFVAAGDWR
jgi:CHAT domain-containing protein